MSKVEELQQILNELQAKLGALKEEEKKEPLKAMLPAPDHLTEYRLSLTMDFPDKETAEAYADAFCVMLELRRMPGSGLHMKDDREAYVIVPKGAVAVRALYKEVFCLCPPFPSEELAQQAAEAVGIERIKKAYATLSGIALY